MQKIQITSCNQIISKHLTDFVIYIKRRKKKKNQGVLGSHCRPKLEGHPHLRWPASHPRGLGPGGGGHPPPMAQGPPLGFFFFFKKFFYIELFANQINHMSWFYIFPIS
jgi:hypothetical protein